MEHPDVTQAYDEFIATDIGLRDARKNNREAPNESRKTALRIALQQWEDVLRKWRIMLDRHPDRGSQAQWDTANRSRIKEGL